MQPIVIAKIKNQSGAAMPVALAVLADAAAYGYDDFTLAAPCVFSGKIVNEAGLLHLTGDITCTVTLACDRCAEAFSLDISADFAENYAQQAKPDDEGDADIHAFSGDTLDPWPEILQTVFLELPMKKLCKADCLGVCPICGKNLNYGKCDCVSDDIDPRLAVLQNLKIKD